MLLAAGWFVLADVFLIDVMFPLGAVVGAFYVLVSLWALRSSAANAIALATVATMANVIGYSLSPTVGIPEWIVGVNRLCATCTTWILIIISLHAHRRTQATIAWLHENNERRRLALEGAQLGFWDRDFESGSVVFDPRWLAMLGYNPLDAPCTAGWYEQLVHPDDRLMLQAAWIEHIGGATEHFEIEHRLRARDGSWRYVLAKGRVLARDPSGNPLRAAGTHLDVTVTRELERQGAHAMQMRIQELQLVTDAIPAMVSYIDSEQHVHFNNVAHQQMFGVTSEQIKGRHFRELIGPQAYERYRPHVAAALRGTRVQFEERVFRADGDRCWLIDFLPRVDDDGRVLGFYNLMTDVTGMKQSEAEVNQQREALSLHYHRSAANEMAAALAHELNQPLASISLYSGGLLAMLPDLRSAPPDFAHALQIVHQEALRAGQVTRQVRALFENRRVRPVETNLDQFLDSVQRICQVRAQPARITVETQLDDSACSVYADPQQLQLVLVNLINNAIEASLEVSDERKRITIASSAGPEGKVLSVIDRGLGLTEQCLDRVFEPHYTTKPEGLGIGLNICKSITAAHGGKLWVTRNATAGVAFHVLLPDAPAPKNVPVLVPENTYV